MAEPSGGAPEPEAKLEEKVVQEAEQEALPEAKPEDKQQPADPREPPPARGELLLTQKGPEADAATGGGTGCGCVPSHALSPFRMSGSDVALGTGGSALRVLRVVRVGFMRVPGDIRRGLHVSRVLQNGRLRRRMQMTRIGTRTRYSGDNAATKGVYSVGRTAQQTTLTTGATILAEMISLTRNGSGRTCRTWPTQAPSPGTSSETPCRTRPASVRTRDQPRDSVEGEEIEGGQWTVGSGQRTPAVCWYLLQCALWSGWLPRCEALPGWGPRPHNNPSPPSTTPCCAHPPSEEGRHSRVGWG